MPRSATSALPARRSTAERALAWIYTGPLGHLHSALADIAVALTGWLALLAWQRIRGLADRLRNP